MFAAEGDPVLIDGAFVSDGESLRESSSRSSRDSCASSPAREDRARARHELEERRRTGSVWTFNLRKNVKFTDGTPFNAGSGLHQLQPPVQPPRHPAGRGTQLLLVHRVRRVREAGRGRTPARQACIGAARSRTTRPRGSSSAGARRRSSGHSRWRTSASPARPRSRSTRPTRARWARTASSARAGRSGPRTLSARGPYKLESWRIGDRLVLVRNDAYWGRRQSRGA